MAADSHSFMVSRDTLQAFGELDYRIYNTIHGYGHHLLDARLTDLAHDAHVSNAAIVRFCKKCGYSGFKELKQAYATSVKQQRAEEPFPTVLKDVREMVSEGDFVAYQHDIQRAFALMRKAHGIVLVGHGRSAGLAVYGAALLSDMQ